MPAPIAPAARRVAANRENARKSTGPRTPAGKARSAMNALKEGVFSRTALLPGEDEDAFFAFVDEMVEDLAPATAQEREIADRVAGLAWRRRRLLLAEKELLSRELSRCGRDSDFVPDPKLSVAENAIAEREHDLLVSGEALARPFTLNADPALLKYADHERRLNGSIDAALRMLSKLQDRRAKHEAAEEEDAIAPAQNEAIAEAPLLTAARRAELPPEHAIASGAQIEPKRVSDPERMRGGAKLAPAWMEDSPGESPSPAQNEPIARDDSATAPARNEPIAESGRAATPFAQPLADAELSRLAREPLPTAPGAAPARAGASRSSPDERHSSEPASSPGHGSQASRLSSGAGSSGKSDDKLRKAVEAFLRDSKAGV